jgi:hypothetical protein
MTAAAKTVVAVAPTSSILRPRRDLCLGTASFGPEYLLRKAICGCWDRARRGDIDRRRHARHVQDDGTVAKGEKVIARFATS